MRIGSDFDGSLTFIDIVALAGFIVSLENLDENLNQSDKQDLQNELAEQLSKVVDEIHKHLEEQDDKIDKILEVINK